MRRVTTLLGAAALALTPAPAARASSRIDVIEHIFGASNVGAVGGHGRLTAGVSPDGDLTVLSWPSPSLRDQLCYLSSNDLDARDLPRNGAGEEMGSFLGLVVEAGGGPQVTFFRDPAWVSSQSYAGPLAPVPVTTFENAALGLTVTVTDIVSPDVDVLTRHVRVERASGSPVTSVSLLGYENLSTSQSRIPELPVGDWAIDTINDYVAVWDSESKAILHFHPNDRAKLSSFIELIDLDSDVDFGPAEALMDADPPADADVDAFVAGIDQSYSSGVAALVTTEPAPESFQVGSDETALCSMVDELLDNILALPETYPEAAIPLDETTADALRCSDQLPRFRAEHGWAWTPQDAFADLADGTLSGSRVAAAQTNGALLAPLSFDGDTAEGAMLFAFGSDRAEARAALDAARELPFDQRLADAEQAASDALGDAPLPDPALGDRVVDVAKRALVNLYVARDREVGAIVASVTRQPPYALDWPRDGAFFNVALDLAGRSDWVSQRLRWYAGVIRDHFTEGTPVFTPNVPADPDSGEMLFPRWVWEMNYYSDGTLGGPIRFEIDNTALHVWSIAVHAAGLPEQERRDLLDDIWPTTRDALDVLVRWKEADTGLPAPANEDDHLELTSTLHGAAATYAGLIAGARLARAAGDGGRARTYLRRARELGDAILDHYFDESAGLFKNRRDGEAGPHFGSTAWLAWPARLLESDDPRLEAQLSADMDAIAPILRGETEGGSYTAKNILSAALYGSDGGARDQAAEALGLLAEVATPGTNHFGETYLSTPDGDGGVTWSNRVATPHVWEGALFYLSAMALTDPAPFTADESLPLPSESSCACRAGAGSRRGALLFALLCLGALWPLRRRARHERIP